METSGTATLLREWRATGPYLPTATSKNGLLPETRLFLQAYRAAGTVSQARADLVDHVLPQRSRTTRANIMRAILARLTRWNPPAWVLDDLVTASTLDDSGRLRSLLLLHHARQETLLYDTVQHLVVPRWQSGEIRISRDEALAFMTDRANHHPEVASWSYETRVKIAGNMLTTLRDYGLLAGAQVKHIVEPAVDNAAMRHLDRLLREEGIVEARIADHTDWRIWLMLPDPVRTRLAIAEETDSQHGRA